MHVPVISTGARNADSGCLLADIMIEFVTRNRKAASVSGRSRHVHPVPVRCSFRGHGILTHFGGCETPTP
jgi:hypothetical protein